MLFKNWLNFFRTKKSSKASPRRVPRRARSAHRRLQLFNTFAAYAEPLEDRTLLSALVSFTRLTPATNPTSADSLVFRATFNGAVSDVDTSDFVVNGATTAIVSDVQNADAGAGLLWDITVSGGDLADFDGTVGLDLALSTITIPDSGPTSPYPLKLTVSGLSGTITDVNVRMNDLTHTYIDDLEALLVSPSGEKVILFGDAGGPFGANHLTFTLDDSAGTAIPNNTQLQSQSYQPASYASLGGLNPPAPAAPYASTLAEFNGIDPNGLWQLFLGDDAMADSGTLGGFTLIVTTASGTTEFTTSSVTITGLDSTNEPATDETYTIDNSIPAEPTADYGDAPTAAQSGFTNSYPTQSGDNGASHTVSGPRLGNFVDAEADGQPNATATLDDTNPVDGDDDEDGVTFLTTLHSSDATNTEASVLVDLQNAAHAQLDAWIDFNQDGQWDASEQIIDDQTVNSGDNVISFDVPMNAAMGTTFARFRVSSAGGLDPTGSAADGEVEDYAVTILAAESGAAVVAVPPSGGTVEIVREGGYLIVRQGSTVLSSTPEGDVTSLVINGADGVDDTLNLDFTGGNPIPSGGLTFNGGAGGNDGINITGGTFQTHTYSYINANDGTISLDPDGSGPTSPSVINFIGLEPIVNSGTATDIVFNLPGGGTDQAILEDDGTPGNGISQIRSQNGTPTFETTFFANPSGSLTVNMGAGSDTFTVAALDSGFDADVNINGEGGDDAISVQAVTGSGTYTIAGGDDSDTLTGPNAATTWDLDATSSFTSGGATVDFSAFETLQGGTDADTFNVTAASTFDLNGGTGDDTFDIDAALTGAVDGEGGSDTLQGDEIDAVALTAVNADGADGTEAGVSAGFTNIETLTGNGGTLTGLDAASTWGLDGTPTYASGGNSVNFSGFATLQGGTDADQFNVTGASTFDVNGGTGDDTFDIDAALTGAVDGEGGSDTLQGDLIDDAVITNSDGNGFDGTEASVSGGFADIETLTGNGGTLTGENAAVTWGLDGTPTYTEGANALNFTGFATLQGGTDADTFNVTAASTFDLNGGTGDDTFDIDAALTGAVDGEGGSDTLQGDEIDAVALTAVNADGADGTEAGVSAGFTNIETLTGNGGTLTGLDAASTWGLDGTPTYASGGNSVNFSGFATLQGGTDADQFNVTGASTFDVNGGTGDDTFDIDAALTGAVDGEGGSDTLQGDLIDDAVITNSDGNGFDGTEASVSGGFADIETLTGNGGTLTGENAAVTWGLDGTPTYTEGANALNFTGFATLQGGTDADTFNVTAASTFDLNGGTGDDTFDIGAALTGAVDGEGGSDTLQGDEIDAVALTAVNADGADGTEAGVSAGFTNIETLTGNGGTLTGLDAASTWGLDGTPTYASGGNSVNFSGFATLQGGTDADQFNVTGASTFDVNGGTGDDTFDIDAALTGAVDGEGGSDTLQGDLIDDAVITNSDGNGFDGTEASVSGGFADIETLTGNGGTLTGENAAVTWGLDGTPTYTEGANALNFTGFATLQGGTDADTFNVTAASTFDLNGGTGDDTFDIDAALTGAVDGEGGSDTLQGDEIDAVALTAVNADGADGTEAGVSAGFTNIETLTGNGGTLTGLDAASTWGLDGTPTYASGGNSVNFSGFATLQGGTDADQFNVTGASTFDVNGGTGDDTFDIDAALTGAVDGEGGSDTLQGDLIDDAVITNSDGNGFDGTEASVSGGFADIETLTGNGGTLTGEDAAVTWGLDGTPTYTEGANALNFTGFATLQGGTDADTFNVTAASTFDLNGGTGDDTFDIDAALTGAVDGEGGSDTLQGDEIDAVALTAVNADGADGTEAGVSAGFTNIETLTGNGGTLTGLDAASTWGLDGTPTYASGGNSVNFSGFATLQGGTDADQFNVTATSVFNLSGGDGSDTFSLGDGVALNGSIDGEGGSQDTLDYSAYTAGVGGSVFVSLVAGTGTNVSGTISGVENVTGGGGDDSLMGDGNNNTLIGNDGNDTLADGAGDDNLQGGLGNDRYILSPGSDDTITDIGGDDTVDFSGVVFGVVFDMDSTAAQDVDGTGANTDTVTLVGTIENFDGSVQDDTLNADALASGVTRSLDGGAGTGDAITIDAQGQTVSITGTPTTNTISFGGGYGAITATNWESITFVNFSGTISVSLSGTAGNDAASVTAVDEDSVTIEGVTYNGVNSLEFNGGDGDDTLTVDLTGATAVLAGGISFVGGETVETNGDSIEVTGYNLNTADGVADVTVNHTGAEAGNVVLAGLGTVSFSETEPLVLGGTAADVVVNLPDVVGTPNTDVVLDNHATAGRIEITGSTFENTDLPNPTNSLVVNLGNQGDTLQIDTLDNAFNADLTVNGGSGSDTASVATAVDINTGSLTVQNVEAIDVNAATTADGGITFTSPTTTNLGASLYTESNDVSITGGSVIIDAALVTIDTESNDTGNGGSVDFTGVTSISADAADRDLTIDTSSNDAAGTGGNVTLVTMGNAGGQFIDDLNVDANSNTNGNVNVTGAIETANTILIDNADTVNLDGNVTGATSVTIQNVATEIDIASDVDLAANGGNLDLNNSVTLIDLSGAGNTNTLSASAAVELSAVSDSNAAGPAELNVQSGTDMTLASVTLDGSNNPVLDLDVDTGADGSQTLNAVGALAAGTIEVNGQGTNETLNFGNTVTSSNDSVTIDGADTVNLDGNVTGATSVTIQNVATEIDIASDVDLAANGGNLDLNNSVTLIDLSGAGNTNTLSASAAVELSAVSDSDAAGPAELNVQSGTDMTLASVTLDGSNNPVLDLDVDTGADGSQTLNAAGALAAGTIEVNGQGTNETLNFGNTVTSSSGSVTIDGADTVNLDGNVTGATSVTIQNVATEIDVASDVDLAANGGNLDLNNSVTLIDLSGAGNTNTLSASAAVELSAVSDSDAAGPAELNVQSGTDMTLASVTLDGSNNPVLDLDVDTGADGSQTLNAAGALAAGTIEVNGQGTNETLNFGNTVTSSSGSVTIDGADTVNLDGNVTGATSVTIQNVATEIDVASDVDLAANGGNLDLNNSVTLIDLSGAGNTNTLSASAAVELSAVSDSDAAGPAELNVQSGTDMTLASVTLDGSNNPVLDLDVDTGADGSQTLNAVGALAAGTIEVNGQGTNETLNFGSTVTSNSGSVTIDGADTVNLDGNVTGATSVTIQNVATEIDVASDVDLAANGGNLDLNNSVTLIDLSGAGNTNTLSASAAVELSAVSDSDAAGPAELNVQSGTDMTLASVTLDGSNNPVLDLDVDTGADGSQTLNAVGALAAGTIEVNGQGTNETLNFGSTVTSNSGSVTVDGADTVNLDGNVTGATSVTIQNVATEIDVASDVDLAANGGNLDLNNSVTLIDLSGAGNTNTLSASAAVELSAVSDSDAAGPAELNVQSGTDMTLASVTLDGSNNPVLDLDVDTGADGSQTLNAVGALAAGTIEVNGQGTNETLNFGSTVTSNSGSVTVDGADTVNLDGNVTGATSVTIQNVATEIDVASDVDLAANGGNLDLNNSVTLIDLSGAGNTNTLSASAAVELSAVSDSDAAGPAELNVQSGTDMTLASVTLDGSNNPVLDLDVDTGADGSQTLNAAGALTAGMIEINGQGTNDTFDLNGPINAVTTLDVSNGTVRFSGGTITTGGTQTYNAAFVLDADSTLNVTGAGNVVFNRTVDTANGADGDLTLNVAGGGQTFFNDQVGTDPLGVVTQEGLGSGVGAAITVQAGNVTFNSTDAAGYEARIRGPLSVQAANVTVSGTNRDNTTIRLVNNANSEVVTIAANGVTLQDATIRDGAGADGYGIFADSVSDVTFERLVVMANNVDGFVGTGITGTVNVNNSSFSQNTQNGFYLDGTFTDAAIQNSTFSNNTSGSGILLSGDLATSTATITSVSGQSNGGDGLFAGILLSLSVSGSSFDSNDANGIDGVAIGTMTVAGTSVQENGGNGIGAIGIGTLNVNNATTATKNAENGIFGETIVNVNLDTITTNENGVDGIYLDGVTSSLTANAVTSTLNGDDGFEGTDIDGTVDIDGGSFSSNGQDGTGNGFSLEGSFTTLTMDNGTYNNNVGGHGIALVGDGDNTATLTDVASNGNGTGGLFDGLNASNLDSLTVSGGTFSSNTGDGIDVDQIGTLTVNNGVTANTNGLNGVDASNVDTTSNGGGMIDASTFNSNGHAGIHFTNVNTTAITNNTIVGNGTLASGGDPDDGIRIESGVGNRISTNTIYGNANLGIDLASVSELANDVTLNDKLLSTTTAVDSLTAIQTTLRVADPAALPAGTDYTIRVDDEVMRVTAVVGDTLTVERAFGSSSAAAHAAGSVVEINPDNDLGPNRLQNTPEIMYVFATRDGSNQLTELTIIYHVPTPDVGAGLTVEFYLADFLADGTELTAATGRDGREGVTLLGTDTYNQNQALSPRPLTFTRAQLSAQVLAILDRADVASFETAIRIVATATHPDDGTSEFSRAGVINPQPGIETLPSSTSNSQHPGETPQRNYVDPLAQAGFFFTPGPDYPDPLEMPEFVFVWDTLGQTDPEGDGGTPAELPSYFDNEFGLYRVSSQDGSVDLSDSIGLFDPSTSTSFLNTNHRAGDADEVFAYGPAGANWVPISGDWDGDGDDTIGLYDSATSVFYLKNDHSGGNADVVFAYGPAGSNWKPIVGDWDGDGTDTVGLYDRTTSTFYLKNSLSGGAADETFDYGPAGWDLVPIAGDWNGDGIDTVGLHNPASSEFFLRNSHSAGIADVQFFYGPAGSGWIPIAGDWDGDNIDTVGLQDSTSSTFFLKNSHSAGVADVTFAYGPASSGWIPVTGNWSTTLEPTITSTSPLDRNENYAADALDPANIDILRDQSGHPLLRESASDVEVQFTNQERVAFYLVRNSSSATMFGAGEQSNPENAPFVPDGTELTEDNEMLLFQDQAMAFFSFADANPDSFYSGQEAKYHIRTELLYFGDDPNNPLLAHTHSGDFTGQLAIYWEDSYAPNNAGLGSSDFDQGVRDGEDVIIIFFDPFVAPVSVQSTNPASNVFDANSGMLSVEADEPNDQLVIQTDESGQVQVLVNGVLDPTLGSVAASAVRSIVVIGGEGPNVIDLSAVTPSAFTSLPTVQIIAGDGDDLIVGSGLNDRVLGGAGNDVFVDQVGGDADLLEDVEETVVVSSVDDLGLLDRIFNEFGNWADSV